MPPGRGGKWHKEAASVPYWFGKSIRRAHFLPVYLRVCHSVGSFEKVPTGCRGAREPWRSGTLWDDAVGKGGDDAEGHLGGGDSVLVPARWGLPGPREALCVEVLVEKGWGRRENDGKGRDGSSGLANQGCLGCTKLALWRSSTWSASVEV